MMCGLSMRTSRIVVVGAGLSGLTAALRLVHAGLDVVVLEARGRVGGRAWRIELDDGLAWDAGAQVLDDAHRSLIGLAAEAGVAVYRADPWLSRCVRWLVGGRNSTGMPPLGADDLALFQALDEEIRALETRIDPGHPEELEDAAALDRQTLAGWLRERGASWHLLAVAEAWYAIGSSSVPIDQMSLLAFAAKHAAGASGPFELRLDGGPGTLAARLDGLLDGRVVLGAQVASVEQDEAGVTIRCANGRVEHGDRAIVAIPLTVQRDIRFEPPLVGSRRLALERARYGDVVKAVLATSGRVKRQTLLTDTAVVLPHDERDDALIVFCASRSAVRLAAQPPAERDADLARVAEAALGITGLETREAVAWTHEPETRGSYVIFGPGDLLAWGRHLPEPLGRLHFAGSEASTLPSYMEGAVRAGERAANEVLAAG
jgi:monoamine oxidase